MLSTLRIKNLALVADLTLDLKPGFNAITGETGAGKSILIGALNLVLGERADRNLIRAGCDRCAVEAVFDLTGRSSPVSAMLEDNGLEPCEEAQLVLKRVFTAAGANRQFVNGSPATLNVLKAMGEWLVDMHGPHDHQSLLQPAHQLAVLDAYGKLDPVRRAFAELVRQRDRLLAEKAGLIMDERAYAQQLDLLRFQVKEIGEARLQAGEEILLAAEHQRAASAARLLELSQQALGRLSEEDPSVMSQAGALGRVLQELRKIDPGTASIADLHEQVMGLLREMQTGLGHYPDEVDLDPSRLRELEDRLNLINALRRKYGATLEEVMAFGEEARRKLRHLEQREGELARLQNEIARLEPEIWQAGAALSGQRQKAIPALGKAVARQLTDLGFKQSRFSIQMQTMGKDAHLPPAVSFPLHGLDTVEFQFAPNPGEPGRPLRTIASSGELARVMLALKTVLAEEDRIPVLIFDEVDANIGGETAQAVGQKMGQIGTRHQVLCITHLAPVAAGAGAHYQVTKDTRAGRTYSEIRLLQGKERINELARMLGGPWDASVRHAASLLKVD